MLKFNKVYSRKDLVAKPSSAWDRESVEVVKEDCRIFAPTEIDDLEDCQLFFEGCDDSDQTEFWNV